MAPFFSHMNEKLGPYAIINIASINAEGIAEIFCQAVTIAKRTRGIVFSECIENGNTLIHGNEQQELH